MIYLGAFVAFNCPQKANQPSPRSGTARLQLPRGRFQPGFSEWADDWEGFLGLGHAVRILGTPDSPETGYWKLGQKWWRRTARALLKLRSVSLSFLNICKTSSVDQFHVASHPYTSHLFGKFHSNVSPCQAGHHGGRSFQRREG
jgi:hypothetical protein